MIKSIIKLTKTTLLATSMVLTVNSCSDEFTNLEPIGGVSTGNFWKSEADAIQASNSLYHEMQAQNLFGRGFFWYLNASDDMVTGRIRADVDNAKNFIMNGDEGSYKNMYADCYKVIRRANFILANVPNMDINEDLKSRILGEAYFMRGFSAFWVAHMYGDNGTNGGVPIVTVENMNAPAGSFERPASVTENYAQIVEDLKAAADLLPIFTTYGDADKGRAHKDAALAYIAKTYLYWAQYDNTKYADAVTYCDAVTNSGSGRALIDTDNPAEDYRLLHSALKEWDTEYIWSVNSSADGGSILTGVMLENKGWGSYNGWGYFQPTEELYNEYEDGDARRAVTILKFGDEFQYFGETRRYQSENSLSGFQFNKYMYEFRDAGAIGTTVNTNGDNPTTAYNVPLLRYAEVLLIKAEALIMQGQNGDAPLNLVRNRAGLAPISNATINDLKHERRVELAGEFANRHFDLVRWGDAQTVYAQPLHGRIHTDRANPDSPYSSEIIWPARNFDPNVNHVWPIPNTAVESSGISQNKGW
ncbi:RagB/SusD family nutrient uptake outer membrane protein [Seonamhaeicola algicola]|uniref:RagB/SusD family nutrient uptake outer membrane protein n=1 Tax=Seonamhaeicola algicola TaxID=1719036 RepID=A0A5C7AI93_9FLAO|nr:RagB/SusD family nutrient uptake outer membrane protein [Seonamhaeicola algicola]TXE07193.1 RagB/SusD family nutrient uptake outer membrane protein [Seonamhaeicola algicola]